MGKKIEIKFIFLFSLKGNWNWPIKVMLVGILIIVIMGIVCFILHDLSTVNPLRWHPPYLVDDTDTLYLEDQHRQQTVLFFCRFLLFLFISFPICQPICVSVGLFAIHAKFLKTCYYEIPRDLRIKNWQKVSD